MGTQVSHSESPRRVASEGAESGWEPVCQSSEEVAPRPHCPPFALAWLPGFDGEEFVGEKGNSCYGVQISFPATDLAK